MTNILVIMLRYLGDVLLATPVTRALRGRFPKAHLAMAVNPGTAEVLEGNPDLDQVLVVERGPLWRQLGFLNAVRAQRFDAVIDLTDGDRSAVLARWTGAPVRIGFNDERYWRGRLYTSVVPGRPQARPRIDRNLDALRPLGVEPAATGPVIHVSAEERSRAAKLLEEAGLDPGGLDGARLAVLHPGARYWFKAWAPERFAELGARLAAEGWRVAIGGGADDRRLAEEIRGRARAEVTIIAGRTSVKQYAAIIERSRLFVTNDNGPMHIAAALGVPVVALFGPTDPAVWGPRGGPCAVLYKGLDCRACFHPGCQRGPESCMNLITVEEAYAAAKQLTETVAKDPTR